MSISRKAGIVASIIMLMGVVGMSEDIHSGNLPLGTSVTIPNIEKFITKDELSKGIFSVYMTVFPETWTVLNGDIYITDGNVKCHLLKRLVKEGDANTGPYEPGKIVTLDFSLKEKIDTSRPVSLVIEPGIYSWTTPVEPFQINVWKGLKVFPRGSSVSAFARAYMIDASTSSGEIVKYEYDIDNHGKILSDKPIHYFLPPQGDADVAAGTVTVYDKVGRKSAERFAIPKPRVKPVLPDEILVGVCFYPMGELTEDEMKALEAEKKDEWGAPYRRERHDVSFYIQNAMENELGNLFVTWPAEEFQKGKFTPEEEIATIGKLADKGIYYMSIYKGFPRKTVVEMQNAGKNKYFLGNNLGEFASYIYQGIGSAEACGVPQKGNLEDCRDWFVNKYVVKGAKSNHKNYDLIFSTCGAAIGGYEMAGGIDVILCELYAIGAANLAYASAEMRGAARKWKPEYWGGWLAHEWQTSGIPFQAKEKFLLLRAGLYQQYLMGSSIVILESGSQTTQSGFYTAESGKRNYGFSEDPPTRYRKEMSGFYKYVKNNPRDKGTPETRFAFALGYCDSFVGIYVDWFAQWSQYGQVEKNKKWLYGDPERTWLAAQDVVFPRPLKALGKYGNGYLAGSPYGQADIVQVDNYTKPDDLQRYKVLAYAGWNSMNDTISSALKDYVEAGGTLFISLPHFSTRLDREYKDFEPGDLIGNGNLSRIIGVSVKGRKSLVEHAAFNDDFLSMKKGSSYLTGSSEILADVVLDRNVEVLCTDKSGSPILVREKRGKGSVILLLTWEYPGKESIAPLYKDILRALGTDSLGETFITETGKGKADAANESISNISYSVYPQKIYLLNIDTQQARTFDLHEAGRVQTITLGPVEFREITRFGN